MAEIPDVIANETIFTNWGNPIRDRTVQRYVDETERESLVPVPSAGDLSYLTASASFEISDGVAWIPYVPGTGGTFTGTVVTDGGEASASFAVRREVGGVDGLGGFSVTNFNGATVFLEITRDGVPGGGFAVMADQFRFMVGGSAGTEIARIAATGINVSDTGDETLPGFRFITATNFGMFLYSPTEIGLSAGGVTAFRASTARTRLPLIPGDQTASSPANVFVGADGRMQQSTLAILATTETARDALVARLAATLPVAVVAATSDSDETVDVGELLAAILDRLEVLETI